MSAPELRRPLSDAAPVAAFALFLGVPVALTLFDIFAVCQARYMFLASLGAYFDYGIVLSGFMFAVSHRALRDQVRSPGLSCGASSLTVAIPAFNEADCITTCVSSVLAQNRLPRQIIVVDDGSTDTMVDVLVRSYDMHTIPTPAGSEIVGAYRSRSFPALVVLKCRHRGKAAALNTALGEATGDIFVTLDADSALAEDALARLTARIDDDEHIVAAGGIVQPANGLAGADMRAGTGALPRDLLIRLQWIEYATGFVWRFGWSRMNTLLLVSGSFSGFRTALLRACGGFDPSSLTEDYEVAYRLHAHCRARGVPYRICTVPDALAFTHAPDTLGALFRQRIRWFQGFLQTLLSYRRLVLNPAYSWLGVFMMPVKAMDALLPLWGLYLYVTLIVSAATERLSLPVSACFVVALIGGRLAVETASGWALLSLRERYIRPALGWRQNLAAAALVPVNAIFQRAMWLAYSLTAHCRLATRHGGRHIRNRRGYQGA